MTTPTPPGLRTRHRRRAAPRDDPQDHDPTTGRFGLLLEDLEARDARFPSALDPISIDEVRPRPVCVRGHLRTGLVDAFASAAGVTELDYVVLIPEVETCVERVLSRSGHGFRDEAAARKMHAEFAPAIVEPRHVLRIDSESAAQVAESIAAAAAAGLLRYSRTTG